MSAKELFSEVEISLLLSCLGFIIYFLISFFKRNEFSVISVQENTGFNNTLNLSDSFFYISLLSLELNSSYHSLRFFYVCHLMLNKIKNKSPRKEFHIEALNSINFAERLLFTLGMRQSRGLSMIELSQRITKESLSCEQIIKTNITQKKLMQILDDSQKEKYFNAKPDFYSQIENNLFITNNV